MGVGEYEESYEQLVRRFLDEQPRLANEVRYKPDEPVAHGWLDDVYQGLEAEGYAVGAVVLPASAVGKAHRRERLWFVGNSQHDGLHETKEIRFTKTSQEESRLRQSERSNSPCTVGNSIEQGLQRHPWDGGTRNKSRWEQKKKTGSVGTSGVWLDCPDGKARPVEPSIPLLAYGLSPKLVKGSLQGFGNAIVPQVAAEFIRASYEK